MRDRYLLIGCFLRLGQEDRSSVCVFAGLRARAPVLRQIIAVQAGCKQDYSIYPGAISIPNVEAKFYNQTKACAEQ